jgi:hypothetical protein
MENFKLSSEMKLEEEGLKWDPSQLYITSKALNKKLPTTPSTLNPKT